MRQDIALVLGEIADPSLALFRALTPAQKRILQQFVAETDVPGSSAFASPGAAPPTPDTPPPSPPPRSAASPGFESQAAPPPRGEKAGKFCSAAPYLKQEAWAHHRSNLAQAANGGRRWTTSRSRSPQPDLEQRRRLLSRHPRQQLRPRVHHHSPKPHLSQQHPRASQRPQQQSQQT